MRGGYIPAAGELVILHVGWGGGSTEIGHLYTDRSGRFHTRYTFLRGNGTVTYRLWATSARETDYPVRAQPQPQDLGDSAAVDDRRFGLRAAVGGMLRFRGSFGVTWVADRLQRLS